MSKPPSPALVCSPARGNYNHDTNQLLTGTRRRDSGQNQSVTQRGDAGLQQEVVRMEVRGSVNGATAVL